MQVEKSYLLFEARPRAWYCNIADILTSHSGYFVAHADFHLFVKANEEKLAIVLVYVETRENLQCSSG